MFRLLSTHKKGIAVIAILTVFAITAIPCFGAGSTSTINNTTTLFTVGNTSCTISSQLTALQPYLESVALHGDDGEPVNINSANSYTTWHAAESCIAMEFSQQFVLSVRIANKCDYDLYVSSGYINLTFDVSDYAQNNYVTFNRFTTGFTLDDLNGNLAGAMYRLGSTANSNNIPVGFRWNPNFSYDNGIILPAKSILSANVIFTMHTQCLINGGDPAYLTSYINTIANNGYNAFTVSNLTCTQPTSASLAPDGWTIIDAGYNSYLTTEAIEHLETELDNNHLATVNLLNTLHSDNVTVHNDLLRIEQLLIDWYGAYNNASSDTNTVIVYASDFSSETDRLHNSESSWYALNDNYISSIGLNNFTYSQSQQDGYGQVQQLFARLWASLGAYSFVYTFALTVSLAVLIIRHRPKIIKGNKNE